jgi:hypothetical protein
MTSNQAQNIIDKFGGVPQLRAALEKVGHRIDRAAVYRWTYPAERRGSGGRIPVGWWSAIWRAAGVAGIELTFDDFLEGTPAEEFLFGLDG